MDIHIETPYENCSLSLIDIRFNDNSDMECTVEFNSGWLSCKRYQAFKKKKISLFLSRIKNISKPFDVMAVLEDIKENMQLQVECIAPGIIMIAGEFYEQSEFEQQARLGFNITEEKMKAFVNQMNALLTNTE